MPLDTARNYSYYHSYLAGGEQQTDFLSIEEKEVLDRYQLAVETQYKKDQNNHLRALLFQQVTYLAAAFSDSSSGYQKHGAVIDVRSTVYNHAPAKSGGEKDLQFIQSIISPLSILFQILEADYDDAWNQDLAGGTADSGPRK